MRRLLRPHVILLIYVVCFGSTGSASATKDEVTAKGVWFHDLEDVSSLTPSGDGQYAWAIVPGGIVLIDAVGAVKHRIMLPSDIKSGALSGLNAQLLPTLDGRSVWLFLRSPARTFLANAEGNLKEVGRADVGAESRDSYYMRYALSSDGRFAWKSHGRYGDITLFQADGKQLDFNLPDQTYVLFDPPASVFTSADNQHIWVVADGIEAPGGAIKVHTRLYLLDVHGKTNNFSQVPHNQILIHQMQCVERNKICCVTTFERAAYCMSEQGSVLNNGKPYFKDDQIKSWRPSMNGRSIWVISMQGGLIQFTPGSSNEKENVSPSHTVERVFPTSAGTFAIGATGAILISVEGKIVHADDSPLMLDVVGVRVAAGGRAWWLVTKDRKLFVMSAEGHLLHGGTEILTLKIPDQRWDIFTRSEEDRRFMSGNPDEILDKHLFSLSEDRLLVADDSGLQIVSKDRVLRKVDVPKGWPTDYSVSPAVDMRYFWISSSRGLFVVNDRGDVLSSDVSQLRRVSYGRIYPSGDGKHAWAAGTGDAPQTWALGLIDGIADLQKATLKFEAEAPRVDSTLDMLRSRSTPLEMDPKGKRWTYELDWAGRDINDKSGAVDVSISRAGVDFATAHFSGDSSADPTVRKSIPFSSSNEVHMTFTDGAGSRIELTSSAVVFQVPWYQSPTVFTLGCFVFVVFVVALIINQRSLMPVTANWLPLGVWTMTGISASLDSVSKSLGIDAPLLVGLLVASFFVVGAAGFFSPSAFRELAQIEPFRRVAPFLLTRKSMRRRLYAGYVEQIGRCIVSARKSAFREHYVALPAKLTWSNGSDMNRCSAPAKEIEKALTVRDAVERPVVMIEAPGGRGKSALQREVTRLVAMRALDDPRLPLPVLCDWREEDTKAALENATARLEYIVKRALGRNLYVPDSLSVQLKAGAYLIVIDGLSDVLLPAPILTQWFQSEYGERTSFLLTTRPDPLYEQALAKVRSGLTVEPLRLDDQTIDEFQKQYIEADLKLGEWKPIALTDTLRRACCTRDGTYLPLLVRLAVALGGGAKTVQDIYGRAVRAILKRASDGRSDERLIQQTADLCLDTYWKTGSRRLSVAGGSPERKELVETLMSAGLLVSTNEAATPFHSSPEDVQFFHDSIQSFLTACGLDAKHGGEEDWTFLEEAAGKPQLTTAQSEILTSGGSEVFNFCLSILQEERLLQELPRHMLRWAEFYGQSISVDTVIESLPLQQRELYRSTPYESARKAIETAVALCEAVTADKLSAIGTLYARLAPTVWPSIIRDRETQKKAEKKDTPAQTEMG